MTLSQSLPVTKPLPVGEIILSKYKITNIVHSGCFGSVYRAFNCVSGRDIALKQIQIGSPDEFSRILESIAQCMCEHRNVVKFYSGDIFPYDGCTYLIIEMEYIPQGSLADRINREFVPVSDSVRYIKDVLFAVQHANVHGVIHRDIKPGNIMLSAPQAKLSDFGVAYYNPAAMEVVRNSFYRPHASPEAIVLGQFDQQSDVFCAGMALFAAVNNYSGISSLVGHSMSSRQFWSDVESGSLVDSIGFKAYIPNRLKQIIKTACHSDLEKRYFSASLFRDALERLTFDNDWTPVNSEMTEWTSRLKHRNAISIDKSRDYRVVFLKNGRKIARYCSAHYTEKLALQEVYKLVRETTLV